MFLKNEVHKAAVILSLVFLNTGCGSKNNKKGESNNPVVEAPAPSDSPKPEDPKAPLIDDAPVNDSAAELKGYVAISNSIKTRIVDQGKMFFLNQYLYGFGSDRVGSLELLLGSYQGKGLTGGYSNGAPNAVNSVLQNLMLGGMARDLGLQCGIEQNGWSNTTYALRESLKVAFAAKLKKLCAWSEVENRDASLLEFWTAVMGYDAPSEEFEAWKSFLKTEYADASGAEVVADGAFAIFYNPYFLLKQ